MFHQAGGAATGIRYRRAALSALGLMLCILLIATEPFSTPADAQPRPTAAAAARATTPNHLFTRASAREAGLVWKAYWRTVGNKPTHRKRKRNIFRGMMIPGLRGQQDCKLPAQIRRRLKRQGWWDFAHLRPDAKSFFVRARRPNGTAYRLKIDACSGRVLEAMRLDEGQRGYRLWPR